MVRGVTQAHRLVLVILLSAAVATLSLWRQGGQTPEAAADHPLDRHFDPWMPRYPRVAEFPLGEELQAGEGAMRMSYFATADPPLRVANFYHSQWEQQGLSVHHNVTPAGGVVGTYDPRTRQARSISIVPRGELTWVCPSTVERPLDTARAGDLGEQDGLPVYPGSSQGLTLRGSDDGRGSLVTTYSNDGGLSKNLAFYRQQLTSRGWTEAQLPELEDLENHHALTFRRDNKRCIVNLTPVEESDRVIVSVMLEDGYDQ